MIPDGGYESVYVGTLTVKDGNLVVAAALQHCAYCKRERGIFPTCDGCGASEWR